MEMWAIWLIVAGILLVLEMMTMTFYLLWLCIGSLVATAVALVAPEAYFWQVVAGCLVALVLTVFTKPLSRKFRAAKGFKDIGTELVGKQGIVVEPIEPGQYGIVKVGGDSWSATATVPIGRDEKVRVLERGSTIIEVERWEEIS
ncbi:NfeD family protein [Paenibacillus sp. DXFW5]|uniref:NfeD family protein n=1 Tax=Paenibacillus rhizolycopersici TaxID=2780073 RepID=A0ABS2H034_9BACL|nr:MULTISPECIES: NfeD family protein [Paenibacillus]MBM6994610.1 NfeD family protein [Paenibacillus rhizolycopersici]MUG87777.1 NfeD family protein [Paenibacillus timonensis]